MIGSRRIFANPKTEDEVAVEPLARLDADAADSTLTLFRDSVQTGTHLAQRQPGRVQFHREAEFGLP